MHGNDSQREVRLGLVDGVRGCLLAGLVLLNTGFLPIDGTQAESAAAFGGCPQVPCPGGCVTGLGPCTVNGPPLAAQQWIGTCTGWCGICNNSAFKCSGITAGLLTCYCGPGC